jgi:hypothetical protein
MDDATESDRWLHLLAYGHPLWMLASIALAALAARTGLRMRNARRLSRPGRRGDRARHLRLAKLAVALLAIGAVGGPLSMAFLRGRAPFETAHGWIGVAAIALYAGAAWLGRSLERGTGKPRDAHAALALLALLASGLAALTGFVLLP